MVVNSRYHRTNSQQWTDLAGFAYSAIRLRPTLPSASAVTMPAPLVVLWFEQRIIDSRTASGFDIPLRIMAETLANESVTTRTHSLSQVALAREPVRLANERALILINQWMSEPDELGAAWWEAFENELKLVRLAFREE